jgi:hypothetical protein
VQALQLRVGLVEQVLEQAALGGVAHRVLLDLKVSCPQELVTDDDFSVSGPAGHALHCTPAGCASSADPCHWCLCVLIVLVISPPVAQGDTSTWRHHSMQARLHVRPALCKSSR